MDDWMEPAMTEHQDEMIVYVKLRITDKICKPKSICKELLEIMPTPPQVVRQIRA